jgi:hypothetical protein
LGLRVGSMRKMHRPARVRWRLASALVRGVG